MGHAAPRDPSGSETPPAAIRLVCSRCCVNVVQHGRIQVIPFVRALDERSLDGARPPTSTMTRDALLRYSSLPGSRRLRALRRVAPHDDGSGKNAESFGSYQDRGGATASRDRGAGSRRPTSAPLRDGQLAFSFCSNSMASRRMQKPPRNDALTVMTKMFGAQPGWDKSVAHAPKGGPCFYPGGS